VPLPGTLLTGEEDQHAVTSLAKTTKATVIPVLRYRDAPRSIEWLCVAFGFEKNLVYSDLLGQILAESESAETHVRH
jgi:hypothetical protein